MKETDVADEGEDAVRDDAGRGSRAHDSDTVEVRVRDTFFSKVRVGCHSPVVFQVVVGAIRLGILCGRDYCQFSCVLPKKERRKGAREKEMGPLPRVWKTSERAGDARKTTRTTSARGKRKPLGMAGFLVSQSWPTTKKQRRERRGR